MNLFHVDENQVLIKDHVVSYRVDEGNKYIGSEYGALRPDEVLVRVQTTAGKIEWIDSAEMWNEPVRLFWFLVWMEDWQSIAHFDEHFRWRAEVRDYEWTESQKPKRRWLGR